MIRNLRQALIFAVVLAVAVVSALAVMVLSDKNAGTDSRAAASASLDRMVEVLAGPAERGNRAQMRLVLQAGHPPGVAALEIVDPGGRVLAKSGETPGSASPTRLNTAIPGTDLSIIAHIQASSATVDTAGLIRRRVAAALAEPIRLAVPAAIMMIGGLAGWAVSRNWRTAKAVPGRAVPSGGPAHDAWQERFANLTAAYNDLVIDHTSHAQARQLERRRFFEDIERQKADLIAARDAAMAEAMARSRFFAGMTHELRTPMNAIMGFSEAIEKQIFGPNQMDRYSDYARDIRMSAKHLMDTINNLLDLAKAESGKLSLSEETLDVGAVLADCLGMMRRLAETAGVRMQIEVAADLAPYRADRGVMRQIVINLLSNAIRFTPAGGTVTVAALADAADDLLITVTDTGKGIAESDMEGIFEPFVQGSIKGEGPGTGLGLPLSRTFARLHGGELMLSSAEGSGTVASLHLPSWRWRRNAVRPVEETTMDAGTPAPIVPAVPQQVAQSAAPPQTMGSASAQLK